MQTVAQVVSGLVVGWRLLDDQLHVSHDVGVAKRLAPIARLQAKVESLPTWTFVDLWNASVRAHSKKESILFEDVSYTFKEVDEESNKIGNWLISNGLKPKDVVILSMENRPEHFFSMLGIMKAGGIVSMVNHNLRLDMLSHAIKLVSPKFVIYGSEMAEPILEVSTNVREALPNVRLHIYVGKSGLGFNSSSFQGDGLLDTIINSSSTNSISSKYRSEIKAKDTACYIYTSGTTGASKACIVSHSKMGYGYGGLFNIFEVKPDDRVYCPLPLYHTSGQLAMCNMVRQGSAVAIARKFRASQYWADCCKHKCTVGQYIGELCRYLLGTKESPYDRKHNVRIVIGNGLRPEIWPSFQNRFNVPQIGEFYGATEGNTALANLCKDPQSQGAVGRCGYILKKLSGWEIVKFDVEKEEPIKDSNGYCIPCSYGEVGELLGKINTKRPFLGYTDPKASEKKLMRNVFQKGDAYFRSGDLLRVDDQGYLYFVDRIGDTFRWKGENVSTLEVSEVLSKFPGIKEANAYGVKVPGTDGRACMVAITGQPEDINAVGLAEYAIKHLPSYAVPRFIRFVSEEGMEITGTFKHRKVTYQNEGFNPESITDPMWWFDPTIRKYSKLDSEAYQRIITTLHSRL